MAHILIIGSLAESLVNFRGDLIRHLVKQGHRVTAAAPAGPAWVDVELAEFGARRITVRMERTGTSVVRDLRFLVELIACFRKERPDTVLAYTIKPVVYGALAAKLAGVPVMAAMITGLGFAFAPPTSVRQAIVRVLARGLYRVTMQCTSIVFFQNPDDEADFKRSGLLRAKQRIVRTNGSGVNLERFGRKPLPAGPLQFLMIARLLTDKGVREYLSAAREVKQAHPEVAFHLVGPFDTNPAAIAPAEIDSAGSRGDVLYHGETDDVRPFLQQCHVYVLPSYREGTPRSVLEALAVGRPVITTDAPGCRETVVPGENGLLVSPRQVAPLVAAMIRLIKMDRSELRCMADASYRLAQTRYDVLVVNAQIATALQGT
jgi:glycosyltransferase involved in cell wall biosynthesis